MAESNWVALGGEGLLKAALTRIVQSGVKTQSDYPRICETCTVVIVAGMLFGRRVSFRAVSTLHR